MNKRVPKQSAKARAPKPTLAPKRPEHLVAQLNEMPAQRCPCGWARRAFAGLPAAAGVAAEGGPGAASIHLVEIEEDSRTHYHKRMTEIYLVLEGTGEIELDGHTFKIKPMTAIYIPPGCRHRARGRLKIINLPVPAFDPADEWFD
jgi:mannose-6-phosphate isomerase-like protein (cupin superfamily)